MTFWWEGVRVECYKGILRVMLSEGVVEREEAGEVFGVGYEGGPN